MTPSSPFVTSEQSSNVECMTFQMICKVRKQRTVPDSRTVYKHADNLSSSEWISAWHAGKEEYFFFFFSLESKLNLLIERKQEIQNDIPEDVNVIFTSYFMKF